MVMVFLVVSTAYILEIFNLASSLTTGVLSGVRWTQYSCFAMPRYSCRFDIVRLVRLLDLRGEHFLGRFIL